MKDQSIEVLRKRAAYHRSFAEKLDGVIAMLDEGDMDFDSDIAEDQPRKGRRGRPKGAKNKPKNEADENAPKRGRGRPKGAKNRPKDGEVGAKARLKERDANAPRRGRPKGVKNATKLPALVMKILEDNKKGLELADIVEQVMAAGYKTASKQDDGLSKIVYQAVHKLVGKNELVKDEEDRYKKIA